MGVRLNTDQLGNCYFSVGVRIASSNNAPLGVEPINSHYYLLQTAIRATQSNTITNQFDRNLIRKSESDIAKLSTNQLKLWLANYQIFEKLNKL